MIAIHHRVGSFSDNWVLYCNENSIKYKIVDCYKNDIIKNIEGCRALFWHWVHGDYRAVIFARQLIFSLEMKDICVFPSIKTCWHFDDKIGQKYLLESIGAPLVSTYVFYDKEEALEWANCTTYPKVFKLKNGAGAMNVQLIKNKNEAIFLIRKMFTSGLSYYRMYLWKERLWHLRRDKNLKSLLNLLKGLGRIFIETKEEKFLPKNIHYAYFQDFIADNKFDYRVMIIGGRAFCFKRFVREDDFRASGSGKCSFHCADVPLDMIRVSFDVAAKLCLQCVAIDYVFQDGKPFIVEMSYAFGNKAFPVWPGYWDDRLEWHSDAVIPEYLMIESVLKSME